ncbi:MAG: hypothetical protein HRS51_02325 [Candidatus Nitrosopelagicus sp.]|nr:hypothetical protein [Candidatus Nitrosopelagicus sp.]
MTEPEPEQDTEYEGSHFTPDIICPFCHQNVKNMPKIVLERDLHIQLRTDLKILKD